MEGLHGTGCHQLQKTQGLVGAQLPGQHHHKRHFLRWARVGESHSSASNMPHMPHNCSFRGLGTLGTLLVLFGPTFREFTVAGGKGTL